MSDSKRSSKGSPKSSPKQAQSPNEDEEVKIASLNADQTKIQSSNGSAQERSLRNSVQDAQRMSAARKSDVESLATSGLTSLTQEVKSPTKSPPSTASPTKSLTSPASTSKRPSTGSGERISMRQRRLEYFRNGTDADCEVHVPKNADTQDGNVCYKKFPCHRIFLATASEKLEQDIFQNKQWNGVLQINGVSPESVEIFLEYIYTFEISTSQADLRVIGDIYILSSAYNMPEMLNTFSKQLKGVEWPLDDIIPAFNLAFQHNMLDLESACLAVSKINQIVY
ncbi:hypothetical protein KR044_003508 [Drosophila immigrans]|nr:hypothetical protein KR044_003508 [Drosophila immigrans]